MFGELDTKECDGSMNSVCGFRQEGVLISLCRPALEKMGSHISGVDEVEVKIPYGGRALAALQGGSGAGVTRDWGENTPLSY